MSDDDLREALERCLAWDNHVALPAMEAAKERLGEPEIDRSGSPWLFVRWPAAAPRLSRQKTTQEERDELRREAVAASRKSQVIAIPISGLLYLLDDADLGDRP